MQGRTKKPDTSTFEEHISPDHLLYKINHLIDFSFVNSLTEKCYHKTMEGRRLRLSFTLG